MSDERVKVVTEAIVASADMPMPASPLVQRILTGIAENVITALETAGFYVGRLEEPSYEWMMEGRPMFRKVEP